MTTGGNAVCSAGFMLDLQPGLVSEGIPAVWIHSESF